MNISGRLNRVSGGNLQAVSISLNSQASTFDTNGFMSAVLPNGEDPNTVTIEWVQVGGSAVTYTSSIDGLNITFTSIDLFRKTFIVYTNRGTLVEQSATAEFLHFPLDKQDTPQEIQSYINFTKTNSITAESISPAIKITGLVPAQADDAQYSVSDSGEGIKRVEDATTIIRAYKDLGEDEKQFISTSELWESISSVWTLIRTVSSYTREFYNLTVSSNPYKVIYKYNHLGLSSDIILNVVDETYKGFSDRVSVLDDTKSYIGISNYSASLQTSKKLNVNSDISKTLQNNQSYIGISNYYFNLQTSKKLLVTDTSTIIAGSESYLGITNYVQSLQTASGAT